MKRREPPSHPTIASPRRGGARSDHAASRDPASPTGADGAGVTTRPLGILRETVIGMAVSAAMSLVAFLLVFGLGPPVVMLDFAWDFIPQTFMASLMGSLAPGLIAAKVYRTSRLAAVGRAVAIAFLAVFVLGCSAMILLERSGGSITSATALVLKASYGAFLGLIVTPPAILLAMRKHP